MCCPTLQRFHSLRRLGKASTRTRNTESRLSQRMTYRTSRVMKMETALTYHRAELFALRWALLQQLPPQYASCKWAYLLISLESERRRHLERYETLVNRKYHRTLRHTTRALRNSRWKTQAFQSEPISIVC